MLVIYVPEFKDNLNMWVLLYKCVKKGKIGVFWPRVQHF